MTEPSVGEDNWNAHRLLGVHQKVAKPLGKQAISAEAVCLPYDPAMPPHKGTQRCVSECRE